MDSLGMGWTLQPMEPPESHLPETGQNDAAGFPCVTSAMLWGWFPLASHQSEARDEVTAFFPHGKTAFNGRNHGHIS